MRVLVVGAVSGGTVPIGGSVYRAFEEMGVETDFLDFSILEREFKRLWAGKDQEGLCRFGMRKKVMLLERIAGFRPDVIFGIAQSPLNDVEMLSELKKAGIVLYYWFTEDYRIFDYWKTIAPLFDCFFTLQKEPFWSELERAGCGNYHYLPMAFDSLIDYPENAAGDVIPVSFVGAPYPNRVHFLSRFPGESLSIYGEDWDKYPNSFVAVGDRRIGEEEARDIYRRSLVNLNLHSSAFPMRMGEGDFINPRTFELAGMGCFQLTDRRKLLPLHFDPAGEVVAVSGWQEMTKAAEYFLEHEEERRAFAKRAQRRVFEGHTYLHRVREVVNLITHGRVGATH